jgi:DNA-binding MurR/RpiR family transcriptional regulator
MSFDFGSIISALQSAGVSPTTIATTVQTLGTSSWQSQAKAKLQQIAAVSWNAPEVAKLVVEMEEIPGLPATVGTTVNALTAPGLTQLQVIELIPTVEAAISAG